ncbi:MAG: FtsX-like permease family protein [Candidatus Cloacimonadota bacterium]|nr:FtsX-like permease family protein [Candidatus Cloacimonadota bacterium]
MYIWHLALKYIKSERQRAVSLGNLISIIGIFLGVFALVVVMSVMNGLEQDITNRIVGLHSEIKVFANDYQSFGNWRKISKRITEEENLQISPVAKQELMLMHDKYVSGTMCKGIQLEKHKKVTHLQENIYIGYPEQEQMANGIILGSDIALTLRANIGDTIMLVSPIADQPTPFGLLPKTKSLEIIALFHTGIPEYDLKYSFTDLSTIQNFIGKGDVISSFEVKTKSPKVSLKVAKKLQKKFDSELIVSDWRDFEKHLFTAIKFEKKIMFLVLVLIFLVAAFNMIGNYLRLISQKYGDIGILKALGSKNKDVVRIFIINGVVIGSAGILLGLTTSLGLLFAQIKWNFFKIPISGMPFRSVPVKIEPFDIILVVAVSGVITLLTTIIPAKRVTKIEPIEVIRKGEE